MSGTHLSGTGQIAVGTAQDMVVALEGSNGQVSETSFESEWGGLDAYVITQDDCVLDPITMDFHLFELCIGGRQHGRAETEHSLSRPETTWRPGAAFFTPAGRRVVNVQAEGSCTNLHIAITDAMMADVKRHLLPGDPDRMDLHAFNESYDHRLREHALAIHHELVHPAGGGALKANALAMALCVELVRLDPASGPARALLPDRLSHAQLGRALDAMEAGMRRDVGMDEIAGAAGVAPARFTTAFRASMGVAPHEHLLARRLACAQRRLRTSGSTVDEIARLCGFATPAQLRSAFARELGTTPTKYRREVSA